MQDDMNITRLRFKCAFQQCKLLEETSRADAMTASSQNCKDKEVWNGVQNSRRNYVPFFQ